MPLEYDPMLSKLIAYAPTREQAIRRLRSALDEYFIAGVASNLGLLRQILEDPNFIAARIDTGYLERWFSARVPAPSQMNGPAEQIAALAAALMEVTSNGHASQLNGANNRQSSIPRWKGFARQEALRER